MKLYIDSVVMSIDDMTDKSDKDRAKLARDSFIYQGWLFYFVDNNKKVLTICPK